MFLWFSFSVSYPFQRFIPVSAFYPHFSVLSPIQRFILAFQCFISISVFYPYFSVVSPFQCFIPISAFYTFIPISISVFSFRFSHLVSAFYPDPFAFGGSCGSLPVTVGYQKWDIMLHYEKLRECFPSKSRYGSKYMTRHCISRHVRLHCLSLFWPRLCINRVLTCNDNVLYVGTCKTMSDLLKQSLFISDILRYELDSYSSVTVENNQKIRCLEWDLNSYLRVFRLPLYPFIYLCDQ